jgi:hypothetical protein
VTRVTAGTTLHRKLGFLLICGQASNATATLAFPICKESIDWMSRISTVRFNRDVSVQILRMMDDAAHHSIGREDEVGVKGISYTLLSMAILPNVLKAKNHDLCEHVWVNCSRSILHL